MSDHRAAPHSPGGAPARREAEWGEGWDDAHATRRSRAVVEPGPETTGAAFGTDLGRARRPLSRRRRWTTMLVATGLMGAGLLVAGKALEPVLGGLSPVSIFGSSDYDGPGKGSVQVTIPEGASGGQIGRILEEAGVVASAETFASLVGLEPRAQSLQPGVYDMRRKMSAAAALEHMLDPATLKVDKVTVREGLWVDETFALLSEKTGTPVEEYEKVDPASLPLPKGAEGKLEGYLYPATYSFSPDAGAQEQLTKLVETGNDVRKRLGIKEADTKRIVTIASIAQGEGSPSNFNQITSVIENRLKTDMNLGMDSTIHFILQKRGNVETTDEERKDPSPYNTYLHKGLPPGPIDSPGEAALDAALHPASTDYYYFVTVDPATGETKFARTFEEHQRYIREWGEKSKE